MIRLAVAIGLLQLPILPAQYGAPVPLAPPAPAAPPSPLAPLSPPPVGGGAPDQAPAAAPPATMPSPTTPPAVAVVPAPTAPAPPAADQPPADQAAPPGTAANLWVPRPIADLQALDKVDARVQSVTLQIGQTVQFGALSITLRACVGRPTDQPQDSAAFLDITDSHAGQASFHGWMFASEPEVSMLEDAVYDIRLNSCHS